MLRSIFGGEEGLGGGTPVSTPHDPALANASTAYTSTSSTSTCTGSTPLSYKPDSGSAVRVAQGRQWIESQLLSASPPPNPSQREAIGAILAGDTPVNLVHGPPGTGACVGACM